MDNLTEAQRYKLMFELALKNMRMFYREEEITALVERETHVFSDEGLYQSLKSKVNVLVNDIQSELAPYIEDRSTLREITNSIRSLTRDWLARS